MPQDPFASGTFSLVLAWVFAIPLFCGFICAIITVISKREGVPWLLSAWFGVCFLVLGPIRYLLFLLVAAESYPVQSGYALVSLFYPVVWFIMIVFGLLFWLSVYLPAGFGAVVVLKPRSNRRQYALPALLAPVIAIISSVLFSLGLPLAAKSTHFLRADDVIGATNGPAYYTYKYVVTIPPVIAFSPPYVAETPGATSDYLRSHVAWLYLSDSEHAHFLKLAYPECYKEYVVAD